MILSTLDPTGLLAEQEGAGDGCYYNGTWIPGCDIPSGASHFAPLTPFTKAVNNLNAAAQAFEDRSNFSQNCQKDIAAIAAAAPSYVDPSSITIGALQAAAGSTVFANGVGSKSHNRFSTLTLPRQQGLLQIRRLVHFLRTRRS